MPSADRLIYDVMYRFFTPGWDRGIIPPELEALVKQDSTRGRALDLGCGTGTNSIYLAQHGFEVTGVDFSPKAIELAYQKAMRAGAPVDFHLADVTRLDFLQKPINLALDVGCFHGLKADKRVRYVANLARLVQPDGKLLLWAFDRPAFLENYGILPTEAERLFALYFKLERSAHSIHRTGRPATWYWFVRR